MGKQRARKLKMHTLNLQNSKTCSVNPINKYWFNLRLRCNRYQFTVARVVLMRQWQSRTVVLTVPDVQALCEPRSQLRQCWMEAQFYMGKLSSAGLHRLGYKVAGGEGCSPMYGSQLYEDPIGGRKQARAIARPPLYFSKVSRFTRLL